MAPLMVKYRNYSLKTFSQGPIHFLEKLITLKLTIQMENNQVGRERFLVMQNYPKKISFPSFIKYHNLVVDLVINHR